MEFKIESLAGPGEVLLTQFVIHSESEYPGSKEDAERQFCLQYPDHVLRFHYGYLEHGGRRVSSQKYAELCLGRSHAKGAFGGAVFGTPR